MGDEKKACRGGETKPVRLYCSGHFEECRACKKQVRTDLVGHWFFGFQTCPKSRPAAVRAGEGE